MPAKNSHLVISALGDDRPGIVNRLAKAIYEVDCNISDSRMTEPFMSLNSFATS